MKWLSGCPVLLYRELSVSVKAVPVAVKAYRNRWRILRACMSSVVDLMTRLKWRILNITEFGTCTQKHEDYILKPEPNFATVIAIEITTGWFYTLLDRKSVRMQRNSFRIRDPLWNSQILETLRKVRVLLKDGPQTCEIGLGPWQILQLITRGWNANTMVAEYDIP